MDERGSGRLFPLVPLNFFILKYDIRQGDGKNQVRHNIERIAY